MSLNLTCSICSDPYLPHAHDYLGVCPWCIVNFAGVIVKPTPDALHVDDDLATRLLLEQAIDEAQAQGRLQARTPRLWR